MIKLKGDTKGDVIKNLDPLTSYDPDDRHKTCRGNERRLQAEIEKLRKHIIAIEDDKTNRDASEMWAKKAESERDQLRAELAEAKSQLTGTKRERDEWLRSCEIGAEMKERCFDAVPGAPDDQPLDVVVAGLVVDLAAAQRDLEISEGLRLKMANEHDRISAELATAQRVVEACNEFGVELMRYVLDYEPGHYGRDWRKKLAVHLSERLDAITAPTHEDAQFMCSARTDIPALVAEVGRLQSKIREAYEIYANSECPESSLRGEEYTLRILHEIVSVLGAALEPDAKDGGRIR